MKRTVPGLALVAAACLFLPAPVPAVSDGFLVEFNFDQLAFRFYPAGLGAASGGDAGSGLQVLAQNVSVEADSAVDLRHCIDSWPEPDCSYGSLLSLVGGGNRDGTVKASEVAAFEQLAGALRQIDKVDRLAKMLEHNITVDGRNGGTPRVASMTIRGAEGDVNSTRTIFVDVTIEVGFANDKNAPRHEIRTTNLRLDVEGFAYKQAAWTVVGDKKWEYKPDQTQPASAKGKVTKTGWTSNQADFETASQGPLLLVLEKAKKKTPGFEFPFVASSLAVLLLRRRI